MPQQQQCCCHHKNGLGSHRRVHKVLVSCKACTCGQAVSSGARIFCSWTRRDRSGSAMLKTHRCTKHISLISVIAVLSWTKRDAWLRQRAPSGATPYSTYRVGGLRQREMCFKVAQYQESTL
jgi:hypothetical protein